MLSFIKHNYIPVLSLFVIFFDEIFNSVVLLLGITTVEGIKQYQAVLLFLIVAPILALDMIGGRWDKWTRQVVFVCFAILGLYALTPLFYGAPPSFYFTYLYCYVAECIPAAYIGSLLAKNPSVERVNVWLPIFLIPVTLTIGTVGLSAAMVGGIVGHDENSGALSYHTLSYMMAFSFSYSCYLCFFGGLKKTRFSRFLKIVLFFTMLFSILICILGGGRGAFLLILAESLFLFFFYFSNSNSNSVIIKSAIVCSVVVIIVFFAIINFDLMESSGISRLQNRLTYDEARASLYNEAFELFFSSPIWGNGLGSIWWTMGIYSHNMIFDFLAETGLLGTSVFVILLLRTIFCSLKLSRVSPVCLLMLIVLMGSLVNGFFSGYWIGSIKLFFICSFVHCKYNHIFFGKGRVGRI